ncbi:hypothetical protein Q4Q34_15455 [Flavivirga abyssicola]|uniref:hypothetical protein n=1 Tax=Flavivirga abyssicola TaxID=3063533 RepID=UPI0026E0A671|nr:hypothetical protein [Flavivirga sp. MEBiC07777]WVK12613.1 hypothetical protein Q4Q34_15455 [Flavivirga sp. MEBiC07777]
MNVKSIKEDSGKIKKMLAAIKKAVSKEFLWILFIMAISIPLALVVSYIISSDAHIISETVSQEIEEVSEIITNQQPLFRVVYGICALGIYFSRMVMTAIKTQLESNK